jgi:hypothetical protein
MSLLLGKEGVLAIKRLWSRRVTLLGGEENLSRSHPALLRLFQDAAKEIPGSPFLVQDFATLSLLDLELNPKDNALSDVFVGRSKGCTVYREILRESPTAPALVSRATELIKEISPDFDERMKLLVRWIVPIRQPELFPERRRCFTDSRFPLVQFLSFAERCCSWSNEKGIEALVLAVDMIHELGHHTLYLLQFADTVVDSSDEEGIYSPVRRVKRPAILAFHAAVAASYMMRFCLAFLHSGKGCEVENAYAFHSWRTLREYQGRALLELKKGAVLTALGKFLLNELEKQVEEPPSDSNLAHYAKINARNYFDFSYA